MQLGLEMLQESRLRSWGPASAGRQGWGYVEPTEAAWELLEGALNPFLDEMRRRVELGLFIRATRG